jgi:hypothetical protein
MLGTFPTQRRSIFYNMHIFIDESGRFISNDGFSAVCALSIPDKSTGPLRREILRISKHWPREEGELKGGLLAVDHLIALTEVLYHHDALLDCCAIDVSLETAALVQRHKATQCENITKHLTSEHAAGVVAAVWQLRRVLEKMPSQLYLQCVLMFEALAPSAELPTPRAAPKLTSSPRAGAATGRLAGSGRVGPLLGGFSEPFPSVIVHSPSTAPWRGNSHVLASRRVPAKSG